MYDHIGLRVKDLKAAARFYEVTLAPLGFVAGSSGDGYAGFGPKDAPALWLHAIEGKSGAAAGTGVHVCFSAPSRAAVDKFHAAGLKAGARDNGPPGLRTDYSPKYYAAFLIDLDGNNVEAVCYK
jgi:catechol 2,3-dioxygenase-like lactoylglutathione lyase family enzyme